MRPAPSRRPGNRSDHPLRSPALARFLPADPGPTEPSRASRQQFKELLGRRPSRHHLTPNQAPAKTNCRQRLRPVAHLLHADVDTPGPPRDAALVEVPVHIDRTVRNLPERDVREQHRRVARGVPREVGLVETVGDDAADAVLVVVPEHQYLAARRCQYLLEPLLVKGRQSQVVACFEIALRNQCVWLL